MLEQEQNIEANYFALELIMEQGMFRQAVTHLMTAPDRPQDLQRAIDLVDDPMVPQLAKKFGASEQMVVIRLCMLGYFAPYVKG